MWLWHLRSPQALTHGNPAGAGPSIFSSVAPPFGGGASPHHIRSMVDPRWTAGWSPPHGHPVRSAPRPIAQRRTRCLHVFPFLSRYGGTLQADDPTACGWRSEGLHRKLGDAPTCPRASTGTASATACWSLARLTHIPVLNIVGIGPPRGGLPTPPRIDSFMLPRVATRRLSAPTPYPTLLTTSRAKFGHWPTSIAGLRRSPPPDTHALRVRRGAGEPRPGSLIGPAMDHGAHRDSPGSLRVHRQEGHPSRPFGIDEEQDSIPLRCIARPRSPSRVGQLKAQCYLVHRTPRSMLLLPQSDCVPQRGQSGLEDHCIPISDWKGRS